MLPISSYLRYPKTLSVAKRNILDFDFNQHVAVIGIASNDMIWKLCWKLNQALSLCLATAEDDVTRVKGPVLYTDYDSDLGFDYIFFENDLKPAQGSKLSRQFRYWLVIKGKKDQDPNAAEVLKLLAAIDIVSLAHDLTAEKDIKKLLP